MWNCLTEIMVFSALPQSLSSTAKANLKKKISFSKKNAQHTFSWYESYGLNKIFNELMLHILFCLVCLLKEKGRILLITGLEYVTYVKI